jgi:hypothetical protein
MDDIKSSRRTLLAFASRQAILKSQAVATFEVNVILLKILL